MSNPSRWVLMMMAIHRIQLPVPPSPPICKPWRPARRRPKLTALRLVLLARNSSARTLMTTLWERATLRGRCVACTRAVGDNIRLCDRAIFVQARKICHFPLRHKIGVISWGVDRVGCVTVCCANARQLVAECVFGSTRSTSFHQQQHGMSVVYFDSMSEL